MDIELFANIAGYIILLMVFGLFYGATAHSVGHKEAMSIWLTAIIGAGIIITGVYLITI